MTTPDTAGLLVTRIVVERHLNADGKPVFSADFIDAGGGFPDLIELLGMLDLARDTAIRFAMLDSDCDCEDDE